MKKNIRIIFLECNNKFQTFCTKYLFINSVFIELIVFLLPEYFREIIENEILNKFAITLLIFRQLTSNKTYP